MTIKEPAINSLQILPNAEGTGFSHKRRIETLKNQIFPLTNNYTDKNGNTIQLWSIPGSKSIAILCGPDGSIRYINSEKIHNALNRSEGSITLHNRLLGAPSSCRWDFVITAHGHLEVWPHLEAQGWETVIPRFNQDLSALARLAQGRTREQVCEWFYRNGYQFSPSRHPDPKIEIHLSNGGHAGTYRADDHQTIKNLLSQGGFIKAIHHQSPTPQEIGKRYIGRGIAFRHPHDKRETTFHVDYTKAIRGGEQTWDLEKDGGYHIDVKSSVIKTKVKISTKETYHANHQARREGREVRYHITLPAVKTLHQNPFKDKLQANNLVKTYNSSHPGRPMPEGRAGRGQIGGVGNEVGIILGLFEGVQGMFEREHAFFFPGERSLTGEEVERLVHELAVGIFGHETVPFFSLHFNGDLNMYPVIHPAYEKTSVGYVIGMLDYYMKGFLNGGFFKAEFVQQWGEQKKWTDEALMSHVVDLQVYCKEQLGENYLSIREMLGILERQERAQEENPALRDYTGFRSSFRIIARQDSIKKTENLFTVGGDFEVLYTITPDPGYEEELAKYELTHGVRPRAYKRLQTAYQFMCEQIKNIMPRLPETKKLFEALHVINFFCYYFSTLKQAGKFPLLTQKVFETHPGCPSIFPHLPIRGIYGNEKAKITLYDLYGAKFESYAKPSNGVKPENHKICSYLFSVGQENGREAAEQEALVHLKKSVRQSTNNPFPKQSEEDSFYTNLVKNSLDVLKHKYAEYYRKRRRNTPAYLESIIQRDFIQIVKNEKEAFFELDIQNGDGFLHPYEASGKDSSRMVQRRVVGGCGLRLDRKPIKVDEQAEWILKDHFAEVAQLEPERFVQLKEGAVFKLGFTDFPLLGEEERELALGSLLPPRVALTDAMVDLFYAIAEGDWVLFREAAAKVDNWGFQDQMGLSPLHHAANSGHLGILNYLMEKVSLKTRDPQGYTALHYAAQNGNEAALQALLSKAPGLIDNAAQDGATPLYVAAQNNQLKTATLLCSKGADYNCITAQGMNPLMVAIHRGYSEMARFLCSKTDCGHTLDDKTTALHMAVEKDLFNVVVGIILSGASINVQRWDGYTPLHLAAKAGNLELVRLFQGRWMTVLLKVRGDEKLDLDIQLKSGKTPLHLAAAGDHADVVDSLLENGANPLLFGWDRETVLHTAVKNGSINSALCLLKRMRDETFTLEAEKQKKIPVLQFKDIHGQTALEVAAKFRMHDLWLAFFDPLHDDPAITGLHPGAILLQLCHPAFDPNVVDAFIQKYKLNSQENVSKYLKPAMIKAAANGHCAMVTLLSLKYSVPIEESVYRDAAKFDHVDLFTSGYQEEHLIIAAKLGSLRCLKLFLQTADQKILPKAMRAAVEGRQLRAIELIARAGAVSLELSAYQAQDQELIDLLKRMGVKLSIYEEEAKKPSSLVQAMIENRMEEVDPNQRDEKLLTPLGVAILKNSLPLVKALIEKEAQLEDCIGLRAETALHLALAQEGSDEIVRFLVEKGAPLMQKDSLGREPIHIAAREGKLCMVRFLHACGASLASQDHGHKTIVHYAAQSSCVELIDFLKEKEIPLDFSGKGPSPLDLAAAEGNIAMIARLSYYGVNFERLNNHGDTTLVYAASSGNPEVLELFSQTPLADDQTSITHAIIEAIRLDSVEQLRILRRRLKTINQRLDPEKGLTMLHIASILGASHIVRDLFADGADPYLVDKAGVSPFAFAVLHNRTEIAHTVAAKGKIDVNSKMPDGRTYLHVAAKHGNIPMMALLIEHGAKIDELDAQGKTALQNAADDQARQFLVCFEGQEGERLLKATSLNNIDAVLTLSKMEDVHQKDSRGKTPLDVAKEQNNLPLTRRLIELHDLPPKPAQQEEIAPPITLSLDEVQNGSWESLHNTLQAFNDFSPREQNLDKRVGAITLRHFPKAASLDLAPLTVHEQIAVLRSFEIVYQTTFYTHLKNKIFSFRTQPSPIPSYEEAQKLMIFWCKALKESVGDFPFYLFLQPDSLLRSEQSGNLLYRGISKVFDTLTYWLFGAPSTSEKVSVNEFVKTAQLLVRMKQMGLETPLDLLQQFKNQALTLNQLSQALENKLSKARSSQAPDIDALLDQFSLQPDQRSLISHQYEIVAAYSKNLKNASLQQLVMTAQEIRRRGATGPHDAFLLLAIGGEAHYFQYGTYPYPVQILTILNLLAHPSDIKGRLAQVRTGEGKTLLTTLLAFVIAGQGKPVDIVAPSRYLAKRDAEKYASFFHAFDIPVSHLCTDTPQEENFKGQILYGTNYDFEFAQMSGNISGQQKLLWMNKPRSFGTVIVDEVDNLFIDATLHSARIAIPSLVDKSSIYHPILEFVRSGKKSPEEATLLAQQLNLPQEELKELMEAAHTALFELKENRDYVLKPSKNRDIEEVTIVDWKNTGRLNEKSRWQSGLHQFVEAKHNLEIQPEGVTAASLSHPIYFNQYQQIYGLTGTLGGKSERDELKTVFNIDTFNAPTHRPNQYKRRDPILVKADHNEAILKEIQDVGERPILVLCETIQKTEELSCYLQEKRIGHQILNELQPEDENLVIDRAGEPGMVTLATNTAGRGTDIILHPKSLEKGGLHVICTFFPKNERVEQQGFGRSSRQGQPGSGRLILKTDQSLEALLEQRAQQTAAESLYRKSMIEQEKSHHAFLEQFWKELDRFYRLPSTLFTAEVINAWLTEARKNTLFDSASLNSIEELAKTASGEPLHQALAILAQQHWAHLFYDKIGTINHGEVKSTWESVFSIPVAPIPKPIIPTPLPSLSCWESVKKVWSDCRSFNTAVLSRLPPSLVSRVYRMAMQPIQYMKTSRKFRFAIEILAIVGLPFLTTLGPIYAIRSLSCKSSDLFDGSLLAANLFLYTFLLIKFTPQPPSRKLASSDGERT